MTSLQPDYSEFKSLSDRTVGYRSRCASDPKREDTTDVSWKLPSAGWISNVRDLTRFVRALMDDTFLGKQARLELWDASVSEAAHANGFEVSGEPADDGWKISRSGSEQNAETYMGFLPNREIGVVAMSNTRGFDGERLWQKLVNELGASRELADVESPCN